MEKMLKRKEKEIMDSAVLFFSKFEEAFARSDKKTFKDNLLPFFATTDDVKQYVRDPYPKYEDRAPDKWNDAIKFLKEYTMANVLRHNTNAKLLNPDNILAPQFSGVGQVVEF